MKKRIKESNEYKMMIESVNALVGSGRSTILYEINAMCNSRKHTYDCYKLLMFEIKHYLEAMPNYYRTISVNATQLYDFIKYDEFKVHQAKNAVKEYDECKMDLETLHTRLIQIFGNIKDAFEWFYRYDKIARK